MTVLIKNGLVLVGEELVRRDVLTCGGKVKRVAENIDESADIVKNAEGCWIIPGAVDVHAHLREPGQEKKETVYSGTRSAAKGGITTLVAMPNLTPVPDSENNLAESLRIYRERAVVRVFPAGAVTSGEKGERVSDIEKLNPLVAFFSDDGRCVNDLDVLDEALTLAKKPVCSHAEAFGAKSSEAAEYVAVEREIKILARHKESSYHFCHLSTKRSFELVESAQKSGLDVTCEVTPHHLFLNQSEIRNANYKMNPPLRSEEDRQATVNALLRGVATIIATDHAPHTPEEKSLPYEKAPNGIIGFETMIPLVYTNLVKTGLASHRKMLEWIVYNPAARFSLPHGEVEEGKAADLAAIDITREREYKEAEILSQGRNSPFIGKKLFGFPVLTLVGGEIAYENI